METYLDSTRDPEDRARDLLSRLTLEEKMGQTVCFWPRLLPSDESLFEENYRYGAGMVSATYMRMFPSVEQAILFQHKWQKLIMEKSPHHIPAIMHLEGICGVTVQDGVQFPCAIARASSFDPLMEEKIGETAGRQAGALGVTQVLAPVLDIARDPRNGRMAESYGEDPTLVSAMGAAYVRGIQEDHGADASVEACAKHFAGFQGSAGGIESSSFEVSGRTYREIHLKPFQCAITESGLRGIMPCYTPVNGEGVSASRHILTEILRDEMGFDGLCTSDYTAISKLFERNRLFETMEDAAYASLLAGMDVETPFRKAFSDTLEEQFRSGERGTEVLDRAVLNILEAKFRMGLFEHPFAMEGSSFSSLYYHDGDRESAEKCTEESMILVKNNGILPLENAPERIAVIGCHASDARYFFGGYTHYSFVEGNYALRHEKERMAEGRDCETYPGSPVFRSSEEDYREILKHIHPDCTTLLEELKIRYPGCAFEYAYGYDPAGSDSSYIDEALSLSARCDLVIMTLGGKYGTRRIATMGEGNDASDITIPQVQQNLVRRISAMGKKIIGIHIDGRPASGDALECLDALIEAWSPSCYGARAITKILSGDVNPSGKYPVSVLSRSGQIPLSYDPMNGSSFTPYTSIGVPGSYVDCPHEPLFAFGHGLSYTSYAYSELQIEEEEDGIGISFILENTGMRKGTEIVQIYASDEHCRFLRRVRELVGFGRITLESGERKRVKAFIRYSQLAFSVNDGKFMAEKGWFSIQVGSSSDKPELEGRFFLAGDMMFDGRKRGFYSPAEAGNGE